MPSPGSTAMATKWRSLNRTLYPPSAVPSPAARRRSGSSVSGNRRHTASHSAAPNSARPTNAARQPHCPAISPPTVGANSGATPITSISRDSSRDASEPVKRRGSRRSRPPWPRR